MLPVNMENNISEIESLFNNYEYMRKNKEELEQIANSINKIIRKLPNFTNLPMAELIHRLKRHIEHQKDMDSSENTLIVNDVMTTNELYYYCYEVHNKFVKFLNKLNTRLNTLKINKIDFDETEKNSFYNQLLDFIQQNQADLLEELLNQNLIDINYGITIIIACQNNNLNAVKMLCNSNARVNPAIESNLIQGTQLLSIALSNKDFNLELINYLLDHGLRINVINNPQYSPLHLLIKKFSEKKIDEIKQILELLFNKGFDINYQNYGGNTILHQTTKKLLSLNFIKYLLSKNPNVNIKNNTGETAFHYLISHLTANVLFRSKIENDVNNYEYYNDNGVLEVSLENLKIVIDLFIINGFDINLQNNWGTTVLHNSITTFVNLDVIKYLLSKNPNAYIVNNDGKTALQLAKDFGYIKAFNLISNYIKNN